MLNKKILVEINFFLSHYNMIFSGIDKYKSSRIQIYLTIGYFQFWGPTLVCNGVHYSGLHHLLLHTLINRSSSTTVLYRGLDGHWTGPYLCILTSLCIPMIDREGSGQKLDIASRNREREIGRLFLSLNQKMHQALWIFCLNKILF